MPAARKRSPSASPSPTFKKSTRAAKRQAREFVRQFLDDEAEGSSNSDTEDSEDSENDDTFIDDTEQPDDLIGTRHAGVDPDYDDLEREVIEALQNINPKTKRRRLRGLNIAATAAEVANQSDSETAAAPSSPAGLCEDKQEHALEHELLHKYEEFFALARDAEANVRASEFYDPGAVAVGSKRGRKPKYYYEFCPRPIGDNADTNKDCSFKKLSKTADKKADPNTFYEISLTCALLRSDIDPGLLDVLKEKLLDTEEVDAGVLSLERGDQEDHLHIQGLVRIRGMTAHGMNPHLKQLLGWGRGSNTHVQCKILTGSALHTWEGMVGYCIKDRAEPHFRSFAKNIDATTLNEGMRQYLKFGASMLKNRAELTPHNIMGKTLLFWQVKKKPRMSTQIPSMDQVLLDMVKSSNYAPSGKFLVPAQGRGMDPTRAGAAWTMLTTPKATTLEEVHHVFFDFSNTTRYFHNRPGETDEEPPSWMCEKSLLRPHDVFQNADSESEDDDGQDIGGNMDAEVVPATVTCGVHTWQTPASADVEAEAEAYLRSIGAFEQAAEADADTRSAVATSSQQHALPTPTKSVPHVLRVVKEQTGALPPRSPSRKAGIDGDIVKF